MLLGCCLCCGDESDETDADADAARGVLDVIVARVGLDAFFARGEEMRRSPEFAAAEAGPALAPSLTRVTAQRLALGGSGDTSVSPHSYDADVARFVVAFEQQVKERVISLYARPRGGVAGGGGRPGGARRRARAPASPRRRAARLKGSLRSAESELEAQGAERRAGGPHEPLTRRGAAKTARRPGSPRRRRRGSGRGSNAPGGNDPDRLASAHSGGASTSSAELRASLDRAAAAAEEELRVTKAELEEARMMVASSEENLRGLSEAYNGLELEVSKRDDELEALRARLEIFEGADAASAPAAAGNPRPQTPDPAALAAAREEGRREAISEMAHRLEETEEAAAAEWRRRAGSGGRRRRRRSGGGNERLAGVLGQEESKTEALMARLIEKHGEKEADLEALLAECAEEEADE